MDDVFATLIEDLLGADVELTLVPAVVDRAHLHVESLEILERVVGKAVMTGRDNGRRKPLQHRQLHGEVGTGEAAGREAW